MTSVATSDPLLAVPSLPEGTRLLHIGPHKTGTTALQAAMWEARAAMLAQGVHPAGSYRNPVSAVRAVTAQPSSYSDRPPPMRDWRAFVREVDRAAEPRLVVSSEYFAHADDSGIRRIVADLDPGRVRVAVTLRPLSRVIPSMWQQNVQAGQRGSLDRWLHLLFPEPPAASGANFWTLHRHHELIARWAEVVGMDRVAAVVVDDRDHAFVLRAFERLLGLRAGTLELVQDRTNRSLTWNEAEAVRAFNSAFRRAGLDRGLHARVMRYGAAQHLKRREPGTDEIPIRLPPWAAERVEAAAAEIVAGIRASGARVIGDLDLLTPSGVGSGGSPGPVPASPAIAATMSMGLLTVAGVARHGPASLAGSATAGSVSGAAPASEAERLPAYMVAGTIATRGLATASIRSNLLRERVRRRFGRATGGARGRERDRDRRVRDGDGYARPRPLEVPVEHMATTHDREPVLLPEGARLIHIGPPKTGTTALQGAFHAARDDAEAQGVHYAGRSRHSVSAAQAIVGRPSFYSVDRPPDRSHWKRLVSEVQHAGDKRVVISSEFFADAKPDAINTIVSDLDASRAHIVITLRPLARILPSQWQQYIQSNMRASYDTWLDAMLNKDESKLSPSFWQRHRHDRLVARWAEVVGPDRVTVVALHEHDHDFVLRAFERLTGLRDGTLVSTPDVTNRSLTMPEVESVRAFNVSFRQEGLERPLHSRVMNFGAARYMRQFEAPADAPRVETPQWALDRAGAIAREMVDAITASGVRVIGDLESLAEVPASRLAGDQQPPVTVPPSVAATMAMGVLYSSGLARDGSAPKDAKSSWNRSSRVPIRGEPLELIRVPTRDLFRLLVRRATSSIRRALPGGRKEKPA
jgi:hypothetical protein